MWHGISPWQKLYNLVSVIKMLQIAEYVTFSMLIRIQYSLETLQGRGDIAKFELFNFNIYTIINAQ